MIEAAGASVFLANMSIPPGELWSDAIRRAIVGSAAGLLLITPNSAKSSWVMAEIGALWVLDKPYLPAVMFPPEDLPELIKRRQWLDIRTAASRSKCVEAVIALLPKSR